MMHIGIDFDDTLLDTRSVFVGILNRIHGVQHRLETLQEYYLAGTYGTTNEHLEAIFSQHFAELHALEPLPGVMPAMRRFQAAGYRLTIITARPGIHMAPLYEWLARHGIPGDRVISAPQSGEKALRAAEEGIGCFIDDNPRHAVALSARGIQVLLLDRPYNRSCQGLGITRVPDWHAIADLLAPSAADRTDQGTMTAVGEMNVRNACAPHGGSTAIFTQGAGFRATD